jgi:hypothetical protein
MSDQTVETLPRKPSHNIETPENKHPIIWCGRCKAFLPHTFAHKEPATQILGDTTKNLVFLCDTCCEPRRYGRERE